MASTTLKVSRPSKNSRASPQPRPTQDFNQVYSMGLKLPGILPSAPFQLDSTMLMIMTTSLYSDIVKSPEYNEYAALRKIIQDQEVEIIRARLNLDMEVQQIRSQRLSTIPSLLVGNQAEEPAAAYFTKLRENHAKTLLRFLMLALKLVSKSRPFASSSMYSSHSSATPTGSKFVRPHLQDQYVPSESVSGTTTHDSHDTSIFSGQSQRTTATPPTTPPTSPPTSPAASPRRKFKNNNR